MCQGVYVWKCFNVNGTGNIWLLFYYYVIDYVFMCQCVSHITGNVWMIMKPAPPDKNTSLKSNKSPPRQWAVLGEELASGCWRLPQLMSSKSNNTWDVWRGEYWKQSYCLHIFWTYTSQIWTSSSKIIVQLFSTRSKNTTLKDTFQYKSHECGPHFQQMMPYHIEQP